MRIRADPGAHRQFEAPIDNLETMRAAVAGGSRGEARFAYRMD